MNSFRILRLQLLFTLLTVLSLHAQDDDVSPDLDPPDRRFHLGFTLGAAAVADRGGMEAVGFGAGAGLDDNGSRYYEEYGCGLQRSVGLVMGVDLDEQLRVELVGGVMQRWVEYEMGEGGKQLLPNASDPEVAVTIPRSTLTFSSDVLLVGAVVGLSWSPLTVGDFEMRLHGGVGCATVLDGIYEGRVKRNPDYREDSLTLLFDPPPVPESVPRQELADTSPLLFSLHGALSLEIPISRIISLVPKLAYGHQLTPLVPDTDWRSNTFGGHLDLVWQL